VFKTRTVEVGLAVDLKPVLPTLADRYLDTVLVSADLMGDLERVADSLDAEADDLEEIAVEAQAEIDRLSTILEDANDDIEVYRRNATTIRELFATDEFDQLTLF
jgi:hypothetical protein